MRSTLQALGKKKADDLRDALEVWQAYFRMFGADRGVFAGDYAIEGDTLSVTVHKCAAWEGAKRAKLEKDVQACLTCDSLWQTWFGTLLPDHDVSQEVIARMGFGDPQCRFRVTAEAKMTCRSSHSLENASSQAAEAPVTSELQTERGQRWIR